MTLRNLSSAALGLALFGCCFPALAALPLGIPLDTPEVSLTLFSADLTVRVEPGTAPFLIAESLSEDGSGGAVEVEHGLQAITARRSDEDRALRLRFDLTLRPGQVLRVVGDGLTMGLDASAASGAQAGNDGAVGPTFDLKLDRSQLTLLAVGGVLFAGTETWLRADATLGPLQLGLVGGSAEIHGHTGPAQLFGEGADFLAEGVDGEARAVLSGGSLEVRQGSGQLTVEATGAAVRLAAWQGPMHVTANASTLETLGCGGEGQAFEVLATQAQVSIDGQVSNLGARLEGGSLLLSGMRGEARVEARAEAQLTVTDYAGALVAVLEGGAAAGVKNVAGMLRVRVEDGRLVLDGIERLDLSASRSEVVATGVRALAKSELADGTAELDLRELSQGPRLAMVGRARASVTLPTPCIVKASGAQAFDGSQLEVIGCDHNAPGQGPRTGTLNRAYGGQALVMTVTLDPTVRLEVEGKAADPP